MNNPIEMGAEFDGIYRYTLFRQWDGTLPTIVFVMLNPSIASGERDDRTVSRCIYYAKLWGYGRLEVRNLYPIVSTDPKVLVTNIAPIDVIRRNEREIINACRERDVIAAWGNPGESYGVHVRRMISAYALNLWHLGPLTKVGAPHHPLRLSNDVERVNWRIR